MNESPIEIPLGSHTMSCTTEEIATTLGALLAEMRSVIPRLREDERDVLRQIMSQESGTLRVANVFPEFARESEAHKTLRRLRAAQFVRPSRSGCWHPGEPIEVKPFARLMWDHIGEDAIFDGIAPAAPAAPAAVPMAAAADEVVDLGLNEEVYGVESPPAAPVEEPVDVAEPAAAAESATEPGPEDEVVDLQDVEEVPAEKAPTSNGKPAAKQPAKSFEDDNMDMGDYDDLCAYAEEELRGKR